MKDNNGSLYGYNAGETFAYARIKTSAKTSSLLIYLTLYINYINILIIYYLLFKLLL